MNFLEKIENLINLFLVKLGELLYKLVPSPVKNILENFEAKKNQLTEFLKTCPARAKPFVLMLITKGKEKAVAYNYKAMLVETYQKALTQYKTKAPGVGKFKTVIMTPVLILGQWLNGLSALQSLMLLTFSGLSVLAVIGIGFSGQKLAKDQFGSDRAPASVIEEDVPYERPEYYKKQTRFFEINNVRLPVYAANVNELRSVDVDFIATTTNRTCKLYLEKHEFQVRDHLILQIEPSVAAFPLSEEGREIIRRKIQAELNDFLKLNGIEGEVVELKITYVLAN